jgi:hypothetical protein
VQLVVLRSATKESRRRVLNTSAAATGVHEAVASDTWRGPRAYEPGILSQGLSEDPKDVQEVPLPADGGGLQPILHQLM